jgi:hypothetical protein
MIEFNPDGSLKVPGHIAKLNEENRQKLKSQICIKVKKEPISFTSPKKCVLHITLSEAITDDRFIGTIYSCFRENTQTPTKIIKINSREIDIEIGTHFRRCAECSSLINRYREFLDGNMIEEQGSCTFEIQKRNFAYEDYF